MEKETRRRGKKKTLFLTSAEHRAPVLCTHTHSRRTLFDRYIWTSYLAHNQGCSSGPKSTSADSGNQGFLLCVAQNMP